MRDHMGKPLPVEIGTRQRKFELAPELCERGEWLCLNIDSNCAWPTRPQSLEIEGKRIWIIPVTEEEFPGVAIQVSKEEDNDQAEGLLYRFISALAWKEGCGISVAHRTGGSMPFMMGRSDKRGLAIRDEFDFTDFALPDAENARIALALMREARSLNHYGYAFLSFWRVLELAFPKSSERVAWMAKALPDLGGPGVSEALKSIASEGADDVGEHLFKSGRCAIAHATGKPIVNPDDPRDARRLYRELPLVREMATRAIEDRFGVLTRSTEYRLHMYELRGWKTTLGDELVGRLRKGDSPVSGEVVDLPDIRIRLRQSSPYASMENLVIARAAVEGGKVLLSYKTADGLLEVRFALDFADERLKFDIEDALFLHDDGSLVAAEYRRDLQRFIRDYFLNGELQIWNAVSGDLMSRKDSFLPKNCIVNIDAFNARLAELDREVERRRAENTRAI